MSLKHAILGFLNYGPSSGSELQKARDASVQHFWPPDQSQIYRTLAQLADEGWAEMELVEQDDRPDRKVYHITAAGRQELHAWLSGHLPHEIYRQPWLIQVFFAAQLSDDEVLALFQHEAGALRRRLAHLGRAPGEGQAYAQAIGSPRDVFFWKLTLESGMARTRAQLQWIESVIERLEDSQLPPQRAASGTDQ